MSRSLTPFLIKSSAASRVSETASYAPHRTFLFLLPRIARILYSDVLLYNCTVVRPVIANLDTWLGERAYIGVRA